MARGETTFSTLVLLSSVALFSGSCGRNTDLKIPKIPKLPSVHVVWDPSEDPDTRVIDRSVTGYRVYYGLKSRDYLVAVDVGNKLEARLENLPRGLVYIAATAYNAVGAESEFSNEISTRLTFADPSGVMIMLGSGLKLK